MRKYYDQELTEVRRFLIKALKTPNKLFEHIRRQVLIYYVFIRISINVNFN